MNTTTPVESRLLVQVPRGETVYHDPNKQYDHLVFIGRMQPYHKGHHQVIQTALDLSNNVIVLLGSANCSRSTRNPFSFEERKGFVLNSFSNADRARITVLPLNDFTYNDQEWIKTVQHIVDDHLRTVYPSASWNDLLKIQKLRVGLIGHSKDASSYYLKLFPTWGHIDVKGVLGDDHLLLNATDIRNDYFAKELSDVREWQDHVPLYVGDWLLHWQKGDTYRYIVDEQDYVLNYRAIYKDLPYPPTFLTADSIVVQSGHVLLVERKSHPGIGKLALPGGYLNPKETLLECALRELKEETRIKVPESVLRGSIRKQETFDDPYRSDRGRIITKAFLFYLQPQMDLPKVRGGDDAKAAFWVPLNSLRAQDFFEDHWHIIHNMLAGL